MRRRDWAHLLVERLERDRGRTDFVWGSSDCLLWCADVARDCLFADGRDWAESIRGKYSTPQEARALIRARGGMFSSISGELGSPYPSAAFARSGDLLALKAGTLGVACEGQMWAWLVGQGISPVAPVECCVRAWPVGW